VAKSAANARAIITSINVNPVRRFAFTRSLSPLRRPEKRRAKQDTIGRVGERDRVDRLGNAIDA
jgi:hypothetical protein